MLLLIKGLSSPINAKIIESVMEIQRPYKKLSRTWSQSSLSTCKKDILFCC